MDASIILQGRQPDYLNVLAQSNAAAQQRINFDQQNALTQTLQQQGPGILAGDPNALNALARFDPQAALGVQSTRLGMDATRQDMQLNAEKMQMAREEGKRVAAERLATQQEKITKEQAAAAAAKIERGVAAAMGAQSPEQWDAIVQQFGQPDLVGQFGNRDAIAGQFIGVAEAYKAFSPSAMNGPADFQSLALRAREAGLVPGSPQYQAFMANDGKTATDPAAEQRIARLMEGGLDRETAIGIVDGRLTTSRDPVDGSVVVVDVANAPRVGSPTPQPPIPQPTASRFGAPFADAQQSFGLAGAVRRGINAAGDAIGVGPMFPQTMQTQADVAAWAENTRAQMLQAYGGKDSVWLTQQIDKLIPRAGEVFTGPDKARAQIIAGGRQMESELRSIEAQMQTQRLKPEDRQELRDKATALRAGVASSQQLLSALTDAPSVTIRPEVSDRLGAYE